MKKIVLVIILIIIFVGTIRFIKNEYKNYKNIEINDDYVAIIYYNEMLAIDAGTQYKYYIYPSDDNTYSYIKTKCDITIAGPREEKQIDSGVINNKSDLEKIVKKINKNKEMEQYFYYTYINNDIKEEYSSIEELVEKLF